MVAETGYPRQGGLSHFDERSMPSTYRLSDAGH